MDFTGFLETLQMIKENKWEVCVIDLPCSDYPSDHCHLVLRLRETGTGEMLTPVEAVSKFLYGNKTQPLEYTDPDFSIHGIAMAANYVDWLRSGYKNYVVARLAMLRVLGISEQSILKRAPRARRLM